MLMRRYRLDNKTSRSTVKAFATGLLSFAAHSPTFLATDLKGVIDVEADHLNRMKVEVTVNVNSLEIIDHVSVADRQEIEGRMRREVLETSRYPEIVFRSTDVSLSPIARGRHHIRMIGPLSLHGATHRFQVEGELVVYDDALRIRGERPLAMPDYGIKPVTALGGTIRLKDEVMLSYDLAFLREAP
jgi:polyisoprenoid-binding protein YceI